MDYFILRADGDRIGPYSLDQLRSMWASGQVNLDMAFWHEGMVEWQLLRSIESDLKPAPIAAASAPVPAQPEKPSVSESKKPGCAKIGGIGCLGALGLFVLFYIFCFITYKPGQDHTPDFNEGYTAGDNAGKLWYHPGESEPSTVAVATLAREVLATDDYKDFHGDREEFIQGYEMGYHVAWTVANNDYVKGR